MSIQLFPKETGLQPAAVADLLLTHEEEKAILFPLLQKEKENKMRNILVNEAGYDPARFSTIASKAIASTNSATHSY